MDLPILARGERWVVVAKPAGLAVHRSKMVNERRNAVVLLGRQLGQRVDPVHRLDRGTSGCLLFSLDRGYTGTLHGALRRGQKRYLAFVRGHIASREILDVETPLKTEDGGALEAHTRVRCMASCAEPRSSLVMAWPTTGRFHQVRRHVRDLSHPVLGDSAHGDTRVNRWWREEMGLGRLGLHCLSLRLELPDEPPVDAVCPVPRDLRSLWERLPWWEEALAAVPELALPPAEDVRA